MTLHHHRKYVISLYVVIVFLYWMALYVYMPTLPVYVRTKTSDLTLVGMVLAMYGLWQTIVRIPVGMAADWLGWRKPLILIGIAMAGVGAWMMGVAPNISFLMMGRAVTGVSAGVWVLMVVAFNALFPAEEAVRATAIITLASSAGRVISTVLTGGLNHLGGYVLPFFVATGFAAGSVLIMMLTKEQRQCSQRPSWQGIGRALTRRDVLFPSVLSTIMQHAFWGASYGFLPILAKQFGASDMTLGMMMTLNIALIMLGNMAAATLGKYIRVHQMMYATFVCMAAGIAAATMSSTILAIYFAQIATGFAWGLGYPLFMGLSIQSVPETERATAMGIHQAVYGIGMFTGPWVSGMLADYIGISMTLGSTASVTLLMGILGTHWFMRHASSRS